MPTACLLIALGFTAVLGLAFFSFSILAKGWSIRTLLKDFNRKMWMTISLGGLFALIYLGAVALGVVFTNIWGTDLFFLIHRHPVECVYGGLFIFACTTLSIYLARMVIKYLYLSRGKDS